jgi:hypothetical protein
MARITIFVALLLILCSCSKAPDLSVTGKTSEGTREEQYKKEMDEIRKSIKGDVKIKLKKDGKGVYSWEIAGKDPQEILKANDTLRKKLGD